MYLFAYMILCDKGCNDKFSKMRCLAYFPKRPANYFMKTYPNTIFIGHLLQTECREFDNWQQQIKLSRNAGALLTWAHNHNASWYMCANLGM